MKKPGPPPPPNATVQPADTVAVDGQAWLREFAAALGACATLEALEDVRKTIGVPAKGKVLTEVWDQGGVLLQAAKNRIELEA